MRRYSLALVAVIACCGASCGGGRSFVDVHASGAVTGIADLDVDVTSAGQTAHVHFHSPSPVAAPLDFSLDFDSSRRGAVHVRIVARDSDGKSRAAGEGDGTIEPGHVTSLTVPLAPDTSVTDGGLDSLTSEPLDSALDALVAPTIDQGTPLDLLPLDESVADVGVADLSVDGALARDAVPPTSDAPLRDAAMPDLATPDLATPDLATPDLARPDLATPDLATPDFAMPDLTRPDLVVTPDLAPCGSYGQPCCDGTTCSDGTACASGLCVAFAGVYGKNCAQSTNPFAGGTARCPAGFTVEKGYSNGDCGAGINVDMEVGVCDALGPGLDADYMGVYWNYLDVSCNRNNCLVANPFTGGCSCPAGSNEVQFEISDNPSNACGFTKYAVLGVCVGKAPVVSFGGAYQVDDRNTIPGCTSFPFGCRHGNPMLPNSPCKCATGTTPIPVRSRPHCGNGWQDFVDSTIFLCGKS